MEVTISISNYTFTDVSDWLQRLDRSNERANFAMWDFAVTLAAGVEQFGRTDARREELFVLASQQIGLSVGTLKTYASAARSPKAAMAIEKGLSFQHARAVLGLDEGSADYLLSQAVANGWPAERLGHEAWAKRNGLPSQRTLNSAPPVTQSNGIAHDTPGRTISPASAYHRGYDDVDARAEQLADDPAAYDESAGDVPFSHHDADEAGYASLWPDERICAMVADLAIEATDADGTTWRTLIDEDVCKLLRTMREEYEAILSR